MDSPLQAWRDTLEELGVMGLVREPVAAPAPVPEPVPARPAARPAPTRPTPQPRPAAAAYLPPSDPVGCPPPEAVAAAATLSDLEQAIRGCLACPLGPGRLKFVFGEGDPGARLMFVGEGPGRDEDQQGRPFVGKAGELLDKMIGAIGLKREETYIANVVKCLRYNAQVLLEDGRWERIGRLVTQRYSGRVMSVDAEGHLVPRRVTGWHRTPLGERRMLRLWLPEVRVKGGGLATTWLTHDHEVLTPRGWVQAEDLTDQDTIAAGFGLSEAAVQVLEGALLGDGHLDARSAHLSIVHAAGQESWARWKGRALEELAPVIQSGSSRAAGKAHPTIRLRTLAARALQDVRKRWYPEGRKRIPASFRLSPMALAVWFLDDGHLRVRPGKAPLAEIAAHGFTQEDRERLIIRLAEDCGVEAYQRPAHPGRIHFGVEATLGLSALIAPFVPPGMRHKLHPHVEATCPFEPDRYTAGPVSTAFTPVRVDREAFRGTDRSVFCLDVEETQNFVTSAGVVHNCRPPDNRTPTPDEARACLGYVRRQIELIRPAVIVTLGATPLRELVGVSEGITRVRGQWKRVTVGGREIPVMPTFHPAYVLRQYTQDVRRAVWEDLKAAKEWVDKAAGA